MLDLGTHFFSSELAHLSWTVKGNIYSDIPVQFKMVGSSLSSKTSLK